MHYQYLPLGWTSVQETFIMDVLINALYHLHFAVRNIRSAVLHSALANQLRVQTTVVINISVVSSLFKYTCTPQLKKSSGVS